MLLCTCSTLLTAQTFTVNTHTDTPDASAGDGFCDDGTGVCTLRAALQEANATAGSGAITIQFSGSMTITPATALPTLSRQNVSIDGGASCGTLVLGTQHTLGVSLDGSALSGTSDGLTLSGQGISISGLAVYNFPDEGLVIRANNIAVSCCYVGLTAAGAAAGNGGHGIEINNSSTGIEIYNCVLGSNADNGLNIGVLCSATIQGNLIGTDPSGSTAQANNHGIGSFGSLDCQIGGTNPADRNVISGNNGDGFNSGGTGSSNNVFEGNYIGLDVTGELALGNAGTGIKMGNANSDYLIGGATSGAANVIASNGEYGIELHNDNIVTGNLIGTDKDGTTAMGNGWAGIYCRINANGNVIGGTSAAEENVIAHNGGDGIEIASSALTGNAIRRNRFFNNAGLPIDLNGDGTTANDADDADTGCNLSQNKPDLEGISLMGTDLAVTYRVESGTSYSAYDLHIDFYLADASGEEGWKWLGEDVYPSTSAGSSRSVVFSPEVALATDDVILALATDANGNSSEFSSTLTLPVHWAYFEATPGSDGRAALAWQTQWEAQNKGFEVQHSLDGGRQWTVMGFVESQGQPATYQFQSPVLDAGLHYFRLRQIDYDGHYAFSEVRTLRMNDAYAPAGQPWLCWPNPVQTSLHLSGAAIEGTQLRIRDVGGRVVGQCLGSAYTALSVHQLLPGHYYLEVRSADHILLASIPFVKE